VGNFMSAPRGNFCQTLFCTCFLLLVVSACQSSFMTHDERVKSAMREIQYTDGISKLEARTIADAYLILYGKYKGRATFSRITELSDVWVGKVYVGKAMASPVDANLPPIVINKSSGKVSWKYGPVVTKIDLEELEAAGPSIAVYKP
jgi:hypothetical protein